MPFNGDIKPFSSTLAYTGNDSIRALDLGPYIRVSTVSITPGASHTLTLARFTIGAGCSLDAFVQIGCGVAWSERFPPSNLVMFALIWLCLTASQACSEHALPLMLGVGRSMVCPLPSSHCLLMVPSLPVGEPTKIESLQ